jgi:hypothetical protein
MNPTSTARELPTLRYGASTNLTFDQNELYDDHFSFNGVEFDISVQQSLPLGLTFKTDYIYQHKTYTYSAEDLTGTKVAAHRIDDRSQITLSLWKLFSLGKENKIKFTGEYNYLRNGSNTAYFIFDKNKFTIGVEYSF